MDSLLAGGSVDIRPALGDAMGSAANLAGKVLWDIALPLDLSQGLPPTLTVANTDSLGEQIQRAYPDARVVKALTTVFAEVMVDPGRVPGEHNIFIAGEDADAKATVTEGNPLRRRPHHPSGPALLRNCPVHQRDGRLMNGHL
ncbi:hypothetical protein [Streptomyces tendae]|uniref:hypothetical protein n=1 Tax=Streptomyces tendae TaxID=1932 RepID=UPI0033DB0F53